MISFLSVFPPYRGGIAKFSDVLYTRLSELTEIRAHSFKKLYPNLLFPGTSQTISSKSGKKYSSRIFHPYQPFNWNKAAKKIMKDKPSVLLYSYWHPFFAPGLVRLLKTCKKIDPSLQRVCVAHNILPHEYFPFKELLTNRLLNNTELTVLLSSQTETDFKKLSPKSAQSTLFHPIYELPNPSATEHELRKQYGFKETDKIILFMGLVRDYKGLDLLIEAMNKLHSEKHAYKVIICGEFYTEKEPLLNLIDRQYRTYYTVIDEFVSEQKMADILSLSNLLVLPYKKGTQSGILANAIYCNLPTLISDLPGLSEHLTHRQNGLIFRKGDAQDLREKLLSYFQEDLQAELSGNLNRLKEELNWKKFARRLLYEVESLEQNTFA